MKNLAGVKEADNYIRTELSEADIQVVEGPPSNGEVPYTLTGKLKGWNLSRAWYYWVARAPGDQGLPLEVATELHNREYPTDSEAPLNMGRGTPTPKTYGQFVRVAGDCGCPPPAEWADHYDADGRELILDPNGEQKARYDHFVEKGFTKPGADVPRFVQSLDGVVAKSVVGSYHIDNQIGLNEFAKVIKGVLPKED